MSLFMISSHRGLGEDYIAKCLQNPYWRREGTLAKKYGTQNVPVASDQLSQKRVYKRRKGLRSFQCSFCHNKFEKFMRMDAQPLKYCPDCISSVRSKNSKQHRKT